MRLCRMPSTQSLLQSCTVRASVALSHVAKSQGCPDRRLLQSHTMRLYCYKVVPCGFVAQLPTQVLAATWTAVRFCCMQLCSKRLWMACDFAACACVDGRARKSHATLLRGAALPQAPMWTRLNGPCNSKVGGTGRRGSYDLDQLK